MAIYSNQTTLQIRTTDPLAVNAIRDSLPLLRIPLEAQDLLDDLLDGITFLFTLSIRKRNAACPIELKGVPRRRGDRKKHNATTATSQQTHSDSPMHVMSGSVLI
ncbi:MAG: hypothetical protein ABR555_00110 [Pyrinomonadaceae bacterium]